MSNKILGKRRQERAGGQSLRCHSVYPPGVCGAKGTERGWDWIRAPSWSGRTADRDSVYECRNYAESADRETYVEAAAVYVSLLCRGTILSLVSWQTCIVERSASLAGKEADDFERVALMWLGELLLKVRWNVHCDVIEIC
jgi:hypothetical protein